MVMSTYLLSFDVCCSSCKVSRSWITVCWWASTTWTRPVENGSGLVEIRGTVGGRKEQWPPISGGHKPRKVCTVQPWSPFRGRLEGRELWIQKTSESWNIQAKFELVFVCSVMFDWDDEMICCVSGLVLPVWAVFHLVIVKERGCWSTLASLTFFSPTGLWLRAAYGRGLGPHVNFFEFWL